jgi:hypothetical protein
MVYDVPACNLGAMVNDQMALLRVNLWPVLILWTTSCNLAAQTTAPHGQRANKYARRRPAVTENHTEKIS